MKKINFVSGYEKKKSSGEKKFFYTVLVLCIIAVAVTGYITLSDNDISDTKPINTKEVLKSSEEKTPSNEIIEEVPSYDVIIPDEDKEKDNEIVITPEVEVNRTNETKIEEFDKIDNISMPVDKSDILKAHSNNVPVFSTTMNDWRIHNGIDISCSIGDNVYACASGTIDDVYIDNKLGATIVIKHDGFMTKYSNLSSVEGAAVGGTVKKGDVIGVVGDTAGYEIADEPHLHFEIIKDGESVDPMKYIK